MVTASKEAIPTFLSFACQAAGDDDESFLSGESSASIFFGFAGGTVHRCAQRTAVLRSHDLQCLVFLKPLIFIRISEGESYEAHSW
jgi:hypothetical protein